MKCARIYYVFYSPGRLRSGGGNHFFSYACFIRTMQIKPRIELGNGMNNIVPSIAIKEANRSRIYHLLRRNSALSRRDIQIELNLSLPTITQNIVGLMDEGLVCQSGNVGNTGGRRAGTYSLVKDARLAVGLDITKHHITAVVVDLSNNIIAKTRISETFEATDTYYRMLGNVVDKIIKDNNINPKSVLGVGIGLPGLTNGENSKIVYGKILDFGTGTKEAFSTYINYDVLLFNDANAACYAELTELDSSTSKNGFYIMLSNNVGGAVFINNSVFSGDDLRSGEVGHIPVHPGGKLCYCGQRGCLDSYCSATVLTRISNGDLDRYFYLLDAKDPEAVKIWDKYLDDLVIAIRTVRMLFDCSVILGGYVGARMEKYMDVVRQKANASNTFDSDSNYVYTCKFKNESIAAGAALRFITDFVSNV